MPVRSSQEGAAISLRFPWRAPLGAAVFRRGDAVWVIFDRAARFDLSTAPHGLPLVRKMEPVAGPGWSGVRIASPATAPVSASADGATWTVTLGPASGTAPEEVRFDQDGAGAPALSARLAGARPVLWLTDPAVGDRVAVVPALPPVKALIDAHAVVGAELLPSAQGLAVQAVADDLEVSSDGDLVRIGRPRGLALSPPGAQRTTVKAAAPCVGASRRRLGLPGLHRLRRLGHARARAASGRATTTCSPALPPRRVARAAAPPTAARMGAGALPARLGAQLRGHRRA